MRLLLLDVVTPLPGRDTFGRANPGPARLGATDRFCKWSLSLKIVPLYKNERLSVRPTMAGRGIRTGVITRASAHTKSGGAHRCRLNPGGVTLMNAHTIPSRLSPVNLIERLLLAAGAVVLAQASSLLASPRIWESTSAPPAENWTDPQLDAEHHPGTVTTWCSPGRPNIAVVNFANPSNVRSIRCASKPAARAK